MLLLLLVTDLEGRFAVVHLGGDRGLALLDLGVVGAGGLSTGLDRSSVGIKLSADGLGVNDSLSKDGNLLSLFDSEGEPVVDLLGELLLAGESVGGVEERARGGNDDTVLAKSLDSSVEELKGLGKVVLPDVTAVDNTGREDLVGAELLEDRLELLGVADKVDVEGLNLGEGRDDIEVVDDVTEVSGDGDSGDITGGSESLVGRLERSLDLGREIIDEHRLVNLDRLGASSLQGLKELNIDRDKLVKERDGVHGGATVSLAKSKERDGSNQDGSGDEASLLSLEELANRLGVFGKGEGLVILESGLDIVVVGVEPLDHLQGRDIYTALLVATAHGEVLVESIELLGGVSIGDSLERGI